MKFMPLFFMALLFCPTPLFAQTSVDAVDVQDIQPNARYDFLSTPQYDQMVRESFSEPANFDFTTFRTLYTATRQYDPLGEITQRQILQNAEAVRNAGTDPSRDQALARYTALVKSHLGNIDIAAMAWAMAKENKIFGDPEYFQWLYNGLLQNIMISGNGRTLNGAYDIMTSGEEAALLHHLPVKILGKTTAHAGIVYYTMYDVEDVKTGLPSTVFVDTTEPMKYWEWQKSRQTSNLNTLK